MRFLSFVAVAICTVHLVSAAEDSTNSGSGFARVRRSVASHKSHDEEGLTKRALPEINEVAPTLAYLELLTISLRIHCICGLEASAAERVSEVGRNSEALFGAESERWKKMLDEGAAASRAGGPPRLQPIRLNDGPHPYPYPYPPASMTREETNALVNERLTGTVKPIIDLHSDALVNQDLRIERLGGEVGNIKEAQDKLRSSVRPWYRTKSGAWMAAGVATLATSVTMYEILNSIHNQKMHEALWQSQQQIAELQKQKGVASGANTGTTTGAPASSPQTTYNQPTKPNTPFV
ncbi:hypothetical protein BCV70DRAFT_208492 [Testicularia cyperi]|uniref:Uncharacterized protein n=1 Tax=Testicularia cyperi TaxID=1882483 RepID=A0A317XGS7_9BASI|nr:hypothetical protein BCV70DRAFT_208492 [Testicularia cyperi]